MFKKFSILLLAFMLIAGVTLASPVNKTLVTATQLDDDPTSVTSDTINIQDYEKIGFVTVYDETEVGNAISGAFTIDFSYDGTNFFDGYFMDWAGASTPQTSETISSDGKYWCWLDPDWSLPPYVRVVFTGTNTDADDLISVAVYIVGVK